MARQMKLPVATVLPVGQDAVPTDNARVLLVDLALLRRTKTFAQIKAQAASWDDAACEEYLLGLMAQGPA